MIHLSEFTVWISTLLWVELVPELLEERELEVSLVTLTNVPRKIPLTGSRLSTMLMSLALKRFNVWCIKITYMCI